MPVFSTYTDIYRPNEMVYSGVIYTVTTNRAVFRTLRNILDGTFCENNG